MSELEPNASDIVGAQRDLHCHLARANSSTQKVTILHPRYCLDLHEDLRECAFSLALDSGISDSEWREHLDRPIVVEVDPAGNLVPFPIGAIHAGMSSAENHAAALQQKLNEAQK